MLLLLDDAFTELQDTFFQEFKEALENVVRAHREGKHIVSGSRQVLERLLALDFLSNESAAMLRQLKNNLPQTGNLPNQLARHVRIIPSMRDECAVIINSHIVALHVPLAKFNDTSTIQESILLSENLTDTYFYEIVANVYAWNKNLSGLKTRINKIGGGGNAVSQQYNEIQERNNVLCLCVVDSDKECPNDGNGQTARNTLNLNNPNKVFTEVVPLEFRDVENMLSCKQLELVSMGDNKRMKALSALEWAENNGIANMRFYFDFKNGIKLSKLYRLPVCHPIREYWLNMLAALPTTVKIPFSATCSNEMECITTCHTDCTVVPGFGDAILSNVLDKLKQLTLLKQRESVCNQTYPEWERVGGIVFSWCCGGNRVVV
jgi:hypothetical protein